MPTLAPQPDPHLSAEREQILALTQEVGLLRLRLHAWKARMVTLLDEIAALREARDTPRVDLYRAWASLTPEEHVQFVIEMLTPPERRMLAYGLEDPDETL